MESLRCVEVKIAFRKYAALIALSRFICSCYSVQRGRRDNNSDEGDAVSRFGGDSRRRRESLNGDLYATHSAGATTHCAKESHCTRSM